MNLEQAALVSRPGDFVHELWSQLKSTKLAGYYGSSLVLPTTHTQVCLFTRSTSKVLQLSDIDSAILSNLPEKEVVAVVENVDIAWILQLGKTWDIDADFFVEHMDADAGAVATRPWSSVFPHNPLESKVDGLEAKLACNAASIEQQSDREAHALESYFNNVPKRSHLTGAFTSAIRSRSQLQMTQNFIRRGSLDTNDAGPALLTRVSSWNGWKAGCRLVLLLVDAPVRATENSGSACLPEMQLQLPISHNRGGLTIPQLVGRPVYSLYECFEQFLSHNWHFNVIFPTIQRIANTADDRRMYSFDAIVFWYIIAASSWKANLDTLDDEIKRISFEELGKNPTTKLNASLHDLRRSLDYLRRRVSLTVEWMPKWLPELLTISRQHLVSEVSHISLPSTMLNDTLDREVSLQKFLMDTFSLLLSSIGVKEAEMMAERNMRAQRLTTLAFVYIPFSFVTGAFGMNVAEINGSPLSLWVPCVALGITIVLTAILFAGMTRMVQKPR